MEKTTKKYVPYGINGMYYIYDNEAHHTLPGQEGSISRRWIKRKCDELNSAESKRPITAEQARTEYGELDKKIYEAIKARLSENNNHVIFKGNQCADLNGAEEEMEAVYLEDGVCTLRTRRRDDQEVFEYSLTDDTIGLLDQIYILDVLEGNIKQ